MASKPSAPPPDGPLTEKPKFSTQNAGIAVLYVEDDFANQQVMEMALSSAGNMTVWLASDGEDALQTLEEEECLPDIILMDNQLADETGPEIIDSIREIYGDAMPFILCTAVDRLEAEKVAEESGCIALICKPYTVAAVLALVQEHAVGD